MQLLEVNSILSAATSTHSIFDSELINL